MFPNNEMIITLKKIINIVYKNSRIYPPNKNNMHQGINHEKSSELYYNIITTHNFLGPVTFSKHLF